MKERDISAQMKADTMLHDIAETISSKTGEDYFYSMTEFIARKLGVEYALVGEFDGDSNTITTISLFAQGDHIDNIKYDLSNTPCKNVIGKDFCIYESNVQKLFPKDEMLVDMKADSYVGIPLFASDRNPIGLIAVIGCNNLDRNHADNAISLLKIFSTRASSEIERNKAEASLIESETRFKAMFNNLDSGVAVYMALENGEDFIIKDLNPAAERLSAVNKKDIIGNKVTEAFPGVKEFGLFEIFQQVWKTGEPRHHPVSLYKDDKLTSWYKNYVYKLPTGDIVAIYEDVTAHMKSDEALKRSEESFRIIFNNATDGILIADIEEKKFLMANDTICNLLGYEKEEIIGLSVKDIHPEADLPYVREQFERQARGEIIIARDLPVMRKGGTVFYADISSKPIVLSGKELLLGIFRDITMQKIAMQKIESISRVPSENPNPFLRIDDTNRILYRNAAFINLLKEKGLSEKDSFKILPDNIQTLVEQVLETDQPIQFKEVTVSDKIISYNIIPIADQGYVNLYGRDVTEKKKVEKELKARTEEVERINRTFVGRELKMRELKKEIVELKKKNK